MYENTQLVSNFSDVSKFTLRCVNELNENLLKISDSKTGLLDAYAENKFFNKILSARDRLEPGQNIVMRNSDLDLVAYIAESAILVARVVASIHVSKISRDKEFYAFYKASKQFFASMGLYATVNRETPEGTKQIKCELLMEDLKFAMFDMKCRKERSNMQVVINHAIGLVKDQFFLMHSHITLTTDDFNEYLGNPG